MSIIMVGKQMFNNFMEFIMPRLGRLMRQRCKKGGNAVGVGKEGENGKMEKRKRWESDFALENIGELGLFNEYLEMVRMS